LPEALGHRRVPLVKRAEYLFDFLEVVKNGYSREVAEAKLAERKKSFEIEKARAVGRGRPFTPTLKKATSLVKHCETLCRQTGLVKFEDATCRLTKSGSRLLQMIVEGQEPDAFLLDTLLTTYPSFGQVIVAINAAKDHEVVLPSTMVKGVFRTVFPEHAARYGIFANLWTFDVVRDLCQQLGVLNWFPESTDGKKMQRVFMTCTMRDDTHGNYETDDSRFPMHATISGRKVIIERNSVELNDFREVVWNEYLKMTKYVPRRPVFYSNLRTRVCHALRIPDKHFDQFARKLMEKDDKYLLVAAGGSLPFSRDSAGMLKSLPPQTSRGEYMVYLKMDERKP
jgi:hypothetical protein